MIKRSSSKQQTQDQFLSCYVINRVLISKDVFSNTHVNQTWNFCFLGQWLCPNFPPHCFYKNKNTKGEKPHFRLTCVAQKCLCLRSLLLDNNIDKTERCYSLCQYCTILIIYHSNAAYYTGMPRLRESEFKNLGNVC